MAGTSLLSLLDDIATLLDDVAILTKVAARKTAGVLGDDLALNAQQVAGVRADRELPVVWAVAKGSALNKLILVPAAIAISAFAPWAVTPLLMIGGAFLCFEGAEKLLHKLLHRKEQDQAEHAQRLAAIADPAVDVVAFERQKIKGAIRTDFILSAEIVAITLGTVKDQPLGMRIAVMTGIAALMTIGVYAFVALIVKLDDAGQMLVARAQASGSPRGARVLLGTAILKGAPYLMRALSIGGTVAMFLVGGGILVHGIPGLEGWLHHLTEGTVSVVALLLPMLIDGVLGVVAGAVIVGVVTLVKKLMPRRSQA
jgi:uncharacterized protein